MSNTSCGEDATASSISPPENYRNHPGDSLALLRTKRQLDERRQSFSDGRSALWSKFIDKFAPLRVEWFDLWLMAGAQAGLNGANGVTDALARACGVVGRMRDELFRWRDAVRTLQAETAKAMMDLAVNEALRPLCEDWAREMEQSILPPWQVAESTESTLASWANRAAVATDWPFSVIEATRTQCRIEGDSEYLATTFLDAAANGRTENLTELAVWYGNVWLNGMTAVLAAAIVPRPEGREFTPGELPGDSERAEVADFILRASEIAGGYQCPVTSGRVAQVVAARQQKAAPQSEETKSTSVSVAETTPAPSSSARTALPAPAEPKANDTPPSGTTHPVSVGASPMATSPPITTTHREKIPQPVTEDKSLVEQPPAPPPNGAGVHEGKLVVWWNNVPHTIQAGELRFHRMIVTLGPFQSRKKLPIRELWLAGRDQRRRWKVSGRWASTWPKNTKSELNAFLLNTLHIPFMVEVDEEEEEVWWVAYQE